MFFLKLAIFDRSISLIHQKNDRYEPYDNMFPFPNSRL